MPQSAVKIAPSILAADFARLGVAAGANVLVAGTSIFGFGQGIEAALRRLKEVLK